jgi:hypothetical protein
MKLNESPQIGDGPRLYSSLYDHFRAIAKKVNALASGSFAAVENTGTAAPTTGTWAQNDFVANSNRTELGVVTAKYVVMGWVCVAGGTPGTWVPTRTLTGN